MAIGDVDGDGRSDMAFIITYRPSETGRFGGSQSWIKFGGPLPGNVPAIY